MAKRGNPNNRADTGFTNHQSRTRRAIIYSSPMDFQSLLIFLMPTAMLKMIIDAICFIISFEKLF